MSHFRDVVTRHHHESMAVLVAAREPCITIAFDEDRNASGRAFRVVSPDELRTLDLPQSWIMAVLLCRGDDTRALAEWARESERDPRRILFYFHEEANPRDALAAWHEAGMPVHATWTVADWRELHKHFGAAWNVRVFDDYRGR